MENEKETVVVTTHASYGDCEVKITAEIPGDDYDNLKKIELEANINHFRYNRTITECGSIQDESDLEELARETLWKELEAQIRIEQDVEYAEYA